MSSIKIPYLFDPITQKITFDWPVSLKEYVEKNTLPSEIKCLLPQKPEFGNAEHAKQFENGARELGKLQGIASSLLHTKVEFLQTKAFSKDLNQNQMELL